MFDDVTMPTIAIAGGFTLLFTLVCILTVRARRIGRRRRALIDARRTSFHLAVIDPTAASHGRAAFERMPSPLQQALHDVRDDQLIEVVDIPLPPPPAPRNVPVAEYTTIGYAPRPPEPRPNMNVRYVGPRLARGSTPGIVHGAPAPAQSLPARPADWDVPAAPSVTARMRTYRRG